MKIGILTWYQAINHGAVLQTYASSQMLEQMGTVPVILDYKWSIYEDANKKSRIIRRIKSVTPSKLLWYLHVKKLFAEKSANFNTFISCYLNVGNYYTDEKKLDAVYIGSDMVFDITEGYNPYMHGEGLPTPYKFSYAASFGYSNIDLLKNSGHYDDIRRNLNNLQAIGYRDKKTLDLCKQLGVTSLMVETIDPVLCYGFEKEIDQWDTGKWRNEKYLLIYAYDSTMNDLGTVSSIKKFARERDLQIISCGYYHKWADRCVPASPNEFLEMFKHAQYVITDTFHGTVFSLILHKRFTSIIRKNGFKVQYLLKCAKLEGQISQTPKEIEKALLNEIDFSEFEFWVATERKKSKDFIEDNLKKAKEAHI